MTKKQIQKSGDNSQLIQAGGDVHVGITYEDARQIALDVFKANFLELIGEAFEVAERRVIELVESFLNKLLKSNPTGLESAKDPDMQYVLFTAQREYARTGEKNLGDLLVDLLVDRACDPERSLRQIVLNESISVAPKLIEKQFSVLSLILMIRYTCDVNIKSLEAFSNFLEELISPFIDGLPKDDSCYQHMEYAGCGSIQTVENVLLVRGNNLESVFVSTFPGIFWKGMEKSNVTSLIGREQSFEDLIIPCLHDPKLFQLSSFFSDSLEKICSERNYSKELLTLLKKFQEQFQMGDNEAKNYILSVCPNISELLDVWKNSPMKNFTLTSVGITIANANIRRKTGNEFNLSMWIK